MPPFLQLVSRAVPLRYFLIIIRSVLLKGTGAATLVDEILALAAFGLALMTVAALRFRKRLD
jgi:ABC-2 type transport system permease protein